MLRSSSNLILASHQYIVRLTLQRRTESAESAMVPAGPVKQAAKMEVADVRMPGQLLLVGDLHRHHQFPHLRPINYPTLHLFLCHM